jgi:hypothetical protein
VSSYITSPRIGTGNDGLLPVLVDLDMRLIGMERRYTGPKGPGAAMAVATVADLPINGDAGDRALVIATGAVHTFNGTTWSVAGTIP